MIYASWNLKTPQGILLNKCKRFCRVKTVDTSLAETLSILYYCHRKSFSDKLSLSLQICPDLSHPADLKTELITSCSQPSPSFTHCYFVDHSSSLQGFWFLNLFEEVLQVNCNQTQTWINCSQMYSWDSNKTLCNRNLVSKCLFFVHFLQSYLEHWTGNAMFWNVFLQVKTFQTYKFYVLFVRNINLSLIHSIYLSPLSQTYSYIPFSLK